MTKKLGATWAGASVVVSTAPLTPKATKQTVARLFLDNLGAGSFYEAYDVAFALSASGRSTGLVIAMGSDVTIVAPIYEGYALPQAPERRSSVWIGMSIVAGSAMSAQMWVTKAQFDANPGVLDSKIP